MSTHDDTRRTDQIESDIERTRAEVSSTIDAIQSKLTPGQMVDEAVQYLRGSGPGEFSMNLGESIKHNPIPVALIGLGVAWLMVGGQRSSSAGRNWSDDQYDVSRREAYRGSRGPRSESWSDARMADDDSDDEGTMHKAAAAASEAGSRVKETLSDAASSVADRARSVKHSLTGTASELAGRTRQRLSGMGQSARRHTGDLMHSRQVERVRSRAMGLVDEQPMLLAAVGVAIGAALGAALPSTRREDRMLGSMRDELVEGAIDTAREQAETVKASAHRVAETAREEVTKVADKVAGEVERATGGSPGAPGAPSPAGGARPGAPH
jgi:ElaB/YqjD/DUF883 family membrane-anchored ribosome-binding protein